MNSLQLLFGFFWGTALGIFYFGGLWITVRKVPRVSRPGRLLLLSFVCRAAAVLGCFLLILRHGPLMFSATVLFFFLTRMVITGILGGTDRRGQYAH